MATISEYIQFVQDRFNDIMQALIDHIIISGAAVLLGSLVAIPVGIWLTRMRDNWFKSLVFIVANIFQTIPSLALLAMLIPLLGIGIQPAIFALFLYSLMPILRNTYAGFQSVDPEVIESAKGMGYNPRQRLLQVELPLAFPYIISGIRLTTVYIISWTTLAYVIGAGGLGLLIFTGLGLNDKQLIVTGAVVAILLALLVDYVLNLVEKQFFVKKSTQ